MWAYQFVKLDNDAHDAYVARVEHDHPVPGPRDLCVAVSAVGLNPLDAKVRRGLVPTSPEVDVAGWDVAGIVDAVGAEVTLFRPGDPVFYAGCLSRPGGMAQLHCVDERIVGRKPKTLGFAETAALPLTGLTAWQLLFDRLAVPVECASSGTLLVIGGGGGVGSMLIQLARCLTGLTVIATASRPESRDWCRSLGAHHVIDHSRPLVEGLAAIGTPAITHIAALNETARHWAEIAAIIAPEGRIGVITDHDTLDAVPLKAKSVTLAWEMVFTRPTFGTAAMIRQHEILTKIARLVDEGALRTTMKRELGPASVEALTEAFRLVEMGRMLGKVVVSEF